MNELRKNEARLEEAQRIAHFGWWERDFTTSRVCCFPTSFAEFLGCSPLTSQNGTSAG